MEKINEGMVQDFCPDCGALVWKGDIGYISQNPNGSDMAREEAMLRHHSGACPASGDFDHIEICPHCGDEVGRWDCEYISRTPNGSDLAISQALEEHREVCPVIQAHLWAEWRVEIDTTIHGRITVDEDTTPRQVLTRLLDWPVSIKKVPGTIMMHQMRGSRVEYTKCGDYITVPSP